MAGSISLSLSQQFDNLGTPLSGGLLYFIQAGTVATPQNAYQDSALTITHPNPLTLNAAGRVPQLFFADGQIKIRLTDANGAVQVTADNVMVVGASSGSGGGGGLVDPTTVFQSGQLVCWHGTGIQSGFVRANGRTIGNAASGASERANADTALLFNFLWNDPNLFVSTGRGASAAADFGAGKTITLPDYRGRVIAGLDDMGTTAAGRLTATYFGTVATVLGAVGGLESHTLTTAQSASHSHGVNDIGHIHPLGDAYDAASGDVQAGAGEGFAAINNTGPGNTASAVTGISIQNAGGGGAHNNTQPTMLATIYIKL